MYVICFKGMHNYSGNTIINYLSLNWFVKLAFPVTHHGHSPNPSLATYGRLGKTEMYDRIIYSMLKCEQASDFSGPFLIVLV